MKGEEAVNGNLGSAGEAKTILLTTYKRDGTPVGTPVSIAFDGDRAFFRSYDKAWKTRRLRNNPQVEFAPATLLTGGQAHIAARALARRHRVLQGILVPLAHRLRGYRTLHYELTADPVPASPGTPAAA